MKQEKNITQRIKTMYSNNKFNKLFIMFYLWLKETIADQENPVYLIKVKNFFRMIILVKIFNKLASN